MRDGVERCFGVWASVVSRMSTQLQHVVSLPGSCYGADRGAFDPWLLRRGTRFAAPRRVAWVLCRGAGRWWGERMFASDGIARPESVTLRGLKAMVITAKPLEIFE